MISAMVIRLGGPDSSYFAGFLFAMLFISFMPSFNLAVTVAAGSTLIFGYATPLLMVGYEMDSTFATNMIFITASMLVMTMQVKISEGYIIEKLKLQYEIEQGKQTAEARGENMARQFDTLFAAAPDGILIMDSAGVIIDANPRFLEMLKVKAEEIVGVDAREFGLLGPEETSTRRLSEMAKGDRSFDIQVADGIPSPLSLEVSSRPLVVDGQVTIQAFYRDITDRKRAQEQLMMAQKMESLGMFAGTIAHDFNNLVSAIMVQLDSVSEPTNEQDRHALTAVGRLTKKASGLVGKLFGFARRGARIKERFNIGDAVEEMMMLLRAPMLKRSVTVTLSAAPAMPLIQAIRSDIEQVLLNLIVNAADAMPSGGAVTVALSHRPVGDDEAAALGLQAGPYFVAEVRDTGSGIPLDRRMRVFEPFHSTKPGGMGLGLATVYSIVRDHGGTVTVGGEPGEGAVFTVFIPGEAATAALPADIRSRMS